MYLHNLFIFNLFRVSVQSVARVNTCLLHLTPGRWWHK